MIFRRILYQIKVVWLKIKVSSEKVIISIDCLMMIARELLMMENVRHKLSHERSNRFIRCFRQFLQNVGKVLEELKTKNTGNYLLFVEDSVLDGSFQNEQMNQSLFFLFSLAFLVSRCPTYRQQTFLKL